MMSRLIRKRCQYSNSVVEEGSVADTIMSEPDCYPVLQALLSTASRTGLTGGYLHVETVLTEVNKARSKTIFSIAW